MRNLEFVGNGTQNRQLSDFLQGVVWEWDKFFGEETRKLWPRAGRPETWVLIANQVTFDNWPNLSDLSFSL